ncbi:TPA: hypothetical protein N5O47_000408 [Enterobacter bugandensis]|nr:hypothetical protein [Enterobacter bugandensis]
MSNIDKQAVQAVADLKAGYTLGNADVAILNELARIALASLEAEAMTQVLSSRAGNDTSTIDKALPEGTMLYTAPPAPVSVPECFTNAVSALESLYRNGQKQNWNERYTTDMAYASGVIRACRAAMLHGAEPVTTAYKLPDGWVAVPVEPTEDMIVNGFESELDESFSDEREWEAYDAMSGCQQAAHRAKLCWAAMIASAPKPEA